ncbi:hypothetical protein B0H19DRAFT_1163764 [Mycena capillaripes]|nr:hypothetical protein B0H19DRAFT_1163764 [Mycena capillaripes]
MLSVVPTVRRRCSVRSAATAAKLKPEPQSTNELPQADRTAALARSKWAPKPKPLFDASSQAGPSTFTSFSGHSEATTSRLSATSKWARPSPAAASPSGHPTLAPEVNSGSRLSATSKWARPTPTAASSSPEQPSATAASAKYVPQSSATARWARPLPSEHSSPKFAKESLPKDKEIQRRSRWPSLLSEEPIANTAIPDGGASERTDARTRWSARSQSTPVRPSESLSAGLPSPPAASRASTQQWTVSHSPSLNQPPHLKWSPPARSTPPLHSASNAHLLSTIDKLLPPSPNNYNKPPDARPADSRQRDVAPHLAGAIPERDPYVFQKTPPQMRPRTQTQTPPISTQKPKQSIETSSIDPESPLESQPQDFVVDDATPEVEFTDKLARPKNTFKERGSLLHGDTPKPVIEPKTNVPKAKKAWAYVEKRVTEDVYIPSTVSVGHLARLLSVRLEALRDKMFQAGMEAQASFDYVLTSDYAVLLAEEFGRKPIVNDEAAFDLHPPPPHPNRDTLPNRPPVVTIMGHVDHGKTTLLDTLRSSSVALGEVGGITQHIGAFSVPVPSTTGVGPQSITFLDTPGHAAFSAMRARGAQVTDIIVLVVAADDGIMPQTREVIELIKKDREKVGVVVAINKIDKPGCDVDALQKALLVEDIHLEELGGDVPSVEVSGLTGQGLPDLVETLSLISEIQDLRAEPEGNVFGYVLESKVVKGLGAIATVLVLRGCLKPGSHILSGVHHAKVRIMHDSNGKMVKTASPGMAVTVSGWKSLPVAGDEVLQGTESEIKRAIVNRQRKADIEAALVDVEAINSSRQQERDRRQAEMEAEATGQESAAKPKEEEPTGPKELRLVIKADVSGSAEAVEGALQGIGNHLAITKVISSSVGPIMESDVMMAKAVGGVIVGFSVPSNRAVETLAAQNGVPIIASDIIYRLMEDVKERVIGLLPTITESKVTGEAKVLQLFHIQVKGKKLKTVAGSRVINGLIEKNKLARVVRNGDVIFDGSFETMRHFKKDVTELRKGNECGLNLAGFDELQVDDVIQTYETIEKPGVL